MVSGPVALKLNVPISPGGTGDVKIARAEPQLLFSAGLIAPNRWRVTSLQVFVPMFRTRITTG